jgi:hypothetical protein
MGLESATYINGLVATNPTASDQKAQGDDHIRLLKSTIQASFPQVTGAVTASHTELSLMDGLTVQPAAKDGSNLTTPDLGDNSTKIATTAFVAAAAFSASLPGQTGQSGNFLTTNGTTASWKQVYPSVTGNNGKFLTTDGITTSWASPLPSQTGNANKALLTDGSNAFWGQAGFTNLVVITSTQTWTAPAWVTKIELTLVNGGQGGNNGAGTPGRGGDAGMSIVTVTPGTAYTATVGIGGTNPSGSGGASSFAGSGLTTATTANSTFKVPGGTYMNNTDGGGSLTAPPGSTGYGAGGAFNGGGQAGVVIIRY